MTYALVHVPDYQEVQAYLSEINEFPLLSAEEEFSLAVRYQDKSNLDAAHKLVTSYLRYVVKIAHEYTGYGLKMMDLIQEGSVGLMKAVKKFDPYKGFRLSTYAMWWIRASIQEFILKSWSLVKIATTTAQRKLFFNLRKSKASIGHLDQMEAQAIGDRLGIDSKLVIEMDGRMSGRDDTLNRPAIEGGDEMQNLVADKRINPEAAMIAEQAIENRRDMVAKALMTLNERERTIITSRIMTDKAETLEKLGKKFNVSRERIRQLEKKALKKLQTALEALNEDFSDDSDTSQPDTLLLPFVG